MQKASDCKSLPEVRKAIDELDQEIIKLIGQRHNFVQKASEFKFSEQHVKAPERFASMLEKRKVWAKEQNLNPEVVANLFKDLVNYFINEELKTWNQQK